MEAIMCQCRLISGTHYTENVYDTARHQQRILCHPGIFPGDQGASLHPHKDSRSYGPRQCLPLLVAIATQYHGLTAAGTKLGSAVQSVPVEQRAGVAFYLSGGPAHSRLIATIRPGANSVYAMLGGMNACYLHAVVKASEPSPIARTAVVTGSY